MNNGQTGSVGNESGNRALRFVRENPLGLMLCGLAIGLIAGALAPVTDVERRKLAPVRDELLEQAQQAVDDVVERGRQVVEETVAAATESASKHGQELVAQLQHDFKLESGAAGA
jgi:hypothetical protein